MKKKVVFLLSFILITTVSIWSQDTIRVLAIGNSFSVDAVEDHLYGLGQGGGVTFIIGNLNIGGCSLERHWGNAENNTADYSYTKIESSGKTTKTKGRTLIEGLNDEEWDFISLQQNSANSGIYDTYFPYLPNLVVYVKEHSLNPDSEVVFHQTWAYASDSKHKQYHRYNSNQLEMYHAIVKASRKAARKSGIKTIIPSGTTIQNGRSSFIGDRFCRDGYHLSYGLGRYTAACAWFEALTGKSVVGNTYFPNNVTPLEATTVQRAAQQAVKKPFIIVPVRLGVPQ